MEYGEDPIEAIQREIREETSINILKSSFEFLCWKNEFFPEEKKHYVTLVFFIECPPCLGSAIVKEPEMCKEWKWFNPDDLPENVFWAVRENTEKYMDKIKNGGFMPDTVVI